MTVPCRTVPIVIIAVRTGAYLGKGEIIRCPWHGWEFDIRTGQSYCDPGRVGTRIYPVAVEGGDTIVEGPYVAETVPVSVENRYVVVTM